MFTLQLGNKAVLPATIAVLCCALSGTVSAAIIMDVTLNTSPLIGHPAAPFALEFELDDGSALNFGGAAHTAVLPLRSASSLDTGDNNNFVTLSNFSFGGGGPVGSPDAGGGVSGDTTTRVRLDDSSASSFYLQTFTPGTQLKFRMTYSNNVDESQVGDTFSFAILDSSGLEIPTQGGSFLPSLLEIDFDSPDPAVLTYATDTTTDPSGGGASINIAAPTVTAAVLNAVPEPGTLGLLGIGLVLLGVRARKVKSKVGNQQRTSSAWLMPMLAATLSLLALGSQLATAQTIQITSPSAGHAVSTTLPEIVVLGTASSAVGIQRVEVSTDRGYSGKAVLTRRGDSGTVAWRSGQIRLQPGANKVTVTAEDNTGHSAKAMVEIDQNIPGAPSTEPQLFTGYYKGQSVTYQVINGLAVAEGDMVLGLPSSLTRPTPGSGPILAPSISTNSPSNLWPKVNGVSQIPYVETRSSQFMKDAIVSYNKTFAGLIQWVPRTNQVDYVDIDLKNQSPNSCYASLGKVGGRQIIEGLVSCDVPVLLHEMGHSTGLWHEQSRSDRNANVAIDFSNIPLTKQSQYSQQITNGIDLGLYDLRSIMQYGPRGFSKNGNPELESIPAGIPFGVSPNFSEGDLDAANRLYGTAPSAVTITSNPIGAQVIVDGATITTPKTFSFALNSTHTVGVPSGPQTIGGTTFMYGKWNDDPSASHTITIAPGNGIFVSPRTSPAITVYMANFIQLAPYTVLFNPDATAGTVTATPAPITFPGVTGQFFTNRQAVSLLATPSAGNTFYGWFGIASRAGAGSNPLNIVADQVAGIQAVFTARPVTSLGTNITINGAITATVDGTAVTLPVNFADDQDAAWTPGSTHTVSVPSTAGPSVSDPAARYLFSKWSDGGAQTRTITAPAADISTYIANYDSQFKLTLSATPGCAGSVAAIPAPPVGGFFAAGTSVTYTPTANAGWNFVGWGGTLSGSSSPLTSVITNETGATGIFSTTNAALAISSLSPALVTAGGPDFVLTLNGAGFTADTTVFVNNFSRTATFVSSNSVTVPITAADISGPGVVGVIVQNSTPDGCTAQARVAPVLVAKP